jgi:hypothetical protein
MTCESTRSRLSRAIHKHRSRVACLLQTGMGLEYQVRVGMRPFFPTSFPKITQSRSLCHRSLRLDHPTPVMIFYPEAQRKAQSEFDSVIEMDRLPVFEDRESLSYANILFKNAEMVLCRATGACPSSSVGGCV